MIYSLYLNNLIKKFILKSCCITEWFFTDYCPPNIMYQPENYWSDSDWHFQLCIWYTSAAKNIYSSALRCENFPIWIRPFYHFELSWQWYRMYSYLYHICCQIRFTKNLWYMSVIIYNTGCQHKWFRFLTFGCIVD